MKIEHAVGIILVVLTAYAEYLILINDFDVVEFLQLISMGIMISLAFPVMLVGSFLGLWVLIKLMIYIFG